MTTTKRSALHAAGLGFLLACMLPLLLVRISFESSLWCDEIYSVLLAHKPAAEIIDQTAIDCHPPGYYFALKSWLALGRLSGFDPGVFWGRMPGVIGWLWLVAAAWFLGRRVFGRNIALLMTCAVAIAAQSMGVAKEMRPYALAYPALFTCFMLLFVLRSSRRQAAGWALYAACASVAMWCHMLSGPLLGLLAILWLLLGFHVCGPRRRSFWLWGLAAHATALISFLPWLSVFALGVEHLGNNQGWMTPPTLKNLLLVFGLWYPIGRNGGEEAGVFTFGWQTFVGTMTVLIPFAAWGWSLVRARKHPVPRRWRRLAACGLTLAVVNVALLWGLNRSGAMLVFHGPRFLVFTAMPWVCGLIGLSQCARIRLSRPQWLTWALMAPWLAASLIGNAIDLRHERNSGFDTKERAHPGVLPGPGETVYVMPSELMPYQRLFLKQWNARPIEEIAKIPTETDSASILLLNNWRMLSSERDMLLLALLKADKLAKSASPSFLPPQVSPLDLDYLTVLRAQGWNHELARQLGEAKFQATPPAAPREAIARVDPRELRMRDGWHFLQVDDSRHPYRWSAADKTMIHLPHNLGPGRYVLHMDVARAPIIHGITRLRVEPPGLNPPFFAKITAGGRYEISVNFEIGSNGRHSAFRNADAGRDPVVTLTHPVADANQGNPNAAAPWMAGIAIYGLWVEQRL